MRVFNIMLSRELGGIQQVYLDYGEALRSQGVEVVDIASWGAAINQRRPDARKLPNLTSWCPVSIALLQGWIRYDRPDIVMAHGTRAVRFAAAFPSKSSTLLGVAHNCWGYGRMRKTGAIISVTHGIRDYLMEQGYPRDKIVVVPNMFRLEQPYVPYHPPPNNRPVVLGSYGRLSEEKGFAHLLEAVSRLRARGRVVHLLLGGAGPLEAALKQQTVMLNLEQQVTFLGWVQDKAAFFASIDLFCLPSLEESFGVALLEAMARSKPILASRVSGPAEVLASGHDALLIQPGNAAALADGVEWLIDHPEQAVAFVEAAYHKLQTTYDMPIVSKQLFQTLKSIA